MNIIRAMLLALMLASLSYTSYAGNGKGIVSHWYSLADGGSNVQHSNFFISNITNHDLVVTITLYNKDGTIYASNLTYNNFQNGNTEIGAGKSVNFKIGASVSGSDNYGYAVIEWKNKGTDNDLVGLVAWADWQQDSPQRGHSIQVNSGNPF